MRTLTVSRCSTFFLLKFISSNSAAVSGPSVCVVRLLITGREKKAVIVSFSHTHTHRGGMDSGTADAAPPPVGPNTVQVQRGNISPLLVNVEGNVALFIAFFVLLLLSPNNKSTDLYFEMCAGRLHPSNSWLL